MRQWGFTLTELIIVMAIIAMLTAFTVPSLLSGRAQAEVNTYYETVLADIKQQQLKAMIGETEGRQESDAYGVYFEADRYTLFSGSVYNPDNPANSPIPLPNTLSFSVIDLPGGSIIFERLSGEVINYDPNSSSITIFNAANNQANTLNFNKLGVLVGGL